MEKQKEEKKELRKEMKMSGRTLWPNLPSEIMDQIFLSLPVKTILRCRCVCKDWNSRLRNPHFLKMHVNRMFAIDSGSTIIIKTVSKLYKVDLDAFHRPIKLDLPFNRTPGSRSHPHGSIVLTGSCNGLLCFTHDHFYGKFVYLWDPARGEYNQLPNHNYDVKRYTRLALGFGYDQISGKFKVVLVRTTGPRKFEAIVFTLGTSSWRSIGELQYPLERSECQVFGGCPHWIVRELKSIVSFSVGNDKFNKIPLPPIDDATRTYTYMTSLGGRLSIFSWESKLKLYELWVRIDDELENSWIKQLSFNLSDIPRALQCSPLGFKNGQVLMHGNKPALFDPVTSEVKTLHLGGKPRYYQVYSYIESLAMLTVEDRGDVHQSS